MIKQVQTRCKFCKTIVYAQWDTDDHCPTEWMDKLLPMLCCNTCADVRTAIKRYEHEFTNLCVRLQSNCNLQAVEARLRQIGLKLGVAYGKFATDNQRRLEEYDLAIAIGNMVKATLERPEQGWDFIDQYRRFVFDLATGRICNHNSIPSETPSGRSYAD